MHTDLLRGYTHSLIVSRRKVKQSQDCVKELMTFIRDSENKDDNIVNTISHNVYQDKILVTCELENVQMKDLLIEINKLNEEIGTLIDSCERQNQHIKDAVLLDIQRKVVNVSDTLEQHDENIYELKKQWRKYLVDNDLSQQLFEDLSSMFQRIQNESTSYKSLLADVKSQLDDMNRFLDLVLQDEKVKHDYEHKYESMHRHKDRILQYEHQFSDVKQRFYKAVERMKELLKLFATSTSEQKRVTCEQLEYIDEEAQKFLEMNRSLGFDIMELQRHLSERRSKLGDLDIKENVTTRRSQFNALFNQITHIEDALTGLTNALECKMISTFDDKAKKQLESLQEEFELLNQRLQDQFEGINDINEQINDLEKIVEDSNDGDNFKNSSLKVLIPHIRAIGELSHNIKQMKQEVEDMENNLEMKKILIGETNIEKKLHNHSQQSLQHRDILNTIKSELDNMQGLIADLYDYASDDEESQHILLIMQSMNHFKDSVNTIDQQCEKTDLEIEQVINACEDVAEKMQFVGQISEIEKQISVNEREVEELNDKLQKKAQRFSEFDLKSKFKKRCKQINEGEGSIENIYNTIKAIQQHGSSNGKMKREIHQTLEQVKETVDTFKALEVQHNNMKNFLNQSIKEQIPNDTFSISIQDQIRLLKDLKTLKDQLEDNNHKLYECLDYLQILHQDLDIYTQSSPYTPFEDDPIDLMVADFLLQSTVISEMQLDFKRIDHGEYQLGQRKITMKLHNDKLLVKVGGGLMPLEEFVQVYGERENKKQFEKDIEEINGRGSFRRRNIQSTRQTKSEIPSDFLNPERHQRRISQYQMMQ